jgi:hypothetical protein
VKETGWRHDRRYDRAAHASADDHHPSHAGTLDRWWVSGSALVSIVAAARARRITQRDGWLSFSG